MKKHYEGRKNLFLESGAHLESSQIFTAFFNIYGVSNIWQDFEYTGRVIISKIT